MSFSPWNIAHIWIYDYNSFMLYILYFKLLDDFHTLTYGNALCEDFTEIITTICNIQWNLYKDHPRDQQCVPYTQVVFICRFNSMQSYNPSGDLYKTWSL